MPVPMLQVDTLKAFNLYVIDNHYIYQTSFFSIRRNDKRDQGYLILPYTSNVLLIA